MMQMTTTPATAQGRSTPFQDLPLHLQASVFASVAAPLNTCKSITAALIQDPSLIFLWLVAKNQRPLLTAARHQLWDVCSMLLHTSRPTPRCPEIRGALEECAAAGKADLVTSLLQLPCRNRHGKSTSISVNSAITRAAGNGHLSVCMLLVGQPRCTDAVFQQALCSAACNGHLDVMALLLDRRPDVSKDLVCANPLALAAGNGDVVTARYVGGLFSFNAHLNVRMVYLSALPGHTLPHLQHGCCTVCSCQHQVDTGAGGVPHDCWSCAKVGSSQRACRGPAPVLKMGGGPIVEKLRAPGNADSPEQAADASSPALM
jgi:hypothetical protein